MKVVIGSENPTKINAVERGFATVWPDDAWEFVGVKVESGVPDQPMDDEEGITGAKNRAHRSIKEVSNARYGVGLEGSIKEIGGVWYATAWIAVVDAKGNEGVGSAPTVVIPSKMAAEILKGKELGIVADEQFKKENVKQKEGYFGIMTNNAITRSEGYRQAVIMALARFLHPEVF